MEFETARMGERGQIVIPQVFRENMDLHKGAQFIVVEMHDSIIFKKLAAPTVDEFELMIKKGHAFAKKHKLTEKDMWDAIRKARASK